MNKQTFLSISDAAKRYNVSSSTIRKIVKLNIDTTNVKTSDIKSRHGFKYLISVSLLDSLYGVKIDLEQAKNNDKTTIKQGSSFDKQKEQVNNQFTNQLIATNKQLCKQVESQNGIIENLTTTLQEQQKVVIAQSLQISRLSPPTDFKNVRDQDTKKTTTIELTIIVVLVVCIVIAIVYLLNR